MEADGIVARTIINPSIIIPALDQNIVQCNDYRPSICPLATTLANIKPIKPTKKRRGETNSNRITGTYSRDYDITKLHKKILQKLQVEHEELPQLNITLNNLNQELQRTGHSLSHIKYTKLSNNIDELQQKIRAIESGQRLVEYNSKSSDLLSKYQRLSGRIRVIFFDQESLSTLTEEDYQRLAIIEQYIQIARVYLDLDLRRISIEPKDLCTRCGASLANVVINENQMRQCPQCETEHSTMTTTRHPKDSAKMIIGGTGDDDSIDNFLKALIRCQGLQTDVPGPKVYQDLDNYFRLRGQPIGEEIRNLPLNEKGKRGNTDHAMLLNALKRSKNSDYYEHVNLIGHVYFGWVLPNLAKYEERIIRHYHATQEVYRSIPIEERNRTSSLGTQLRLYLHLRLIHYPCDKEDFKIAESPESLANQLALWQRMCDGCEDNEIVWWPDMY